MRISIVLFCAGGLALSLVMVVLGVSHRTVKQAKGAALSVELPSHSETGSSSKADDFPPLPATFFVVADTASLLQQIQTALNSDGPADIAAVFTNQLLTLIRDDPWAVARFAETNETKSWQPEVMRVLAQNWAGLNLADAAKWVAQIGNLDERDTMLGCVCFQVAQTNPGQAIQTLEQQGLDDARRQTMLGNLAQQWAALDLPAAINWAGNYPPGENRDNLFMQIALAESQSSPPDAARLLVGQISPGPIQAAAAMTVLQQWAAQDFAGASAWAAQFPPGDLYDRARDELAGITAYQANHPATEAPVGLQ